MAYIASVKRIGPMLETPGARVLVAVKTQQYADSLLIAIRNRIDEAAAPWAGSILFMLAGEVRMPNGSLLRIAAMDDIQKVEEGAAAPWSYLLYSYMLDADVKERLLTQVRAAAPYAGPIGSEQFEGWKDDPLDSTEQTRESE